MRRQQREYAIARPPESWRPEKSIHFHRLQLKAIELNYSKLNWLHRAQMDWIDTNWLWDISCASFALIWKSIYYLLFMTLSLVALGNLVLAAKWSLVSATISLAKALDQDLNLVGQSSWNGSNGAGCVGVELTRAISRFPSIDSNIDFCVLARSFAGSSDRSSARRDPWLCARIRSWPDLASEHEAEKWRPCSKDVATCRKSNCLFMLANAR